MQHDLIIVGSGPVGAAAGYYARHVGLNTPVIDAHQSPHQEGSRHDSSRLIRHAYGEDEKYVPLVLCVQQLWDELAKISGEAVFERTGVINLGPVNSSFLADVAVSTRTFDSEVGELDAQTAMQRRPEIRLPDDYRTILESAPGVLHSELAVETWIRLAQETGCAQLFNCPVSVIYHHVDGVIIGTFDGEYHGKGLLIGAGTWVTHLLPDLSIQSVRKVLAWFQADGRYSGKNHFLAFTGELPNSGQYYGFPTEDNGLKTDRRSSGQSVSTPQERSAFDVVVSGGSESLPFLRNILPRIGGCLYGAFCIYDNTVDEDFVIDIPPGRSDTLPITGLSDHGFKFAPVLGEIASQFAQGQTLTSNLTPFSLARLSS